MIKLASMTISSSVSPMVIRNDKSNEKDTIMTLQDRVNSIHESFREATSRDKLILFQESLKKKQEAIREATSKDKLIFFQESLKKKQEAIREATSKEKLISLKESLQKKASPILFNNQHDLSSTANNDRSTTTNKTKSKLTISIMNCCRGGGADENLNNKLLSPSSILSITKKKAMEAEIDRRRTSIETYTKDVKPTSEEIQGFMNYTCEFYCTIDHLDKNIQQLLKKHPNTLGRHYNELVIESNRVSHEDFWLRYFYKCNEERIQIGWKDTLKSL